MFDYKFPKVKNNFIKSNPLFKFFIFLISGFFLGIIYFEFLEIISNTFLNFNSHSHSHSNLQPYFSYTIAVALIIINIYLFIKKYFNLSYILISFSIGFCCYYYNFYDYDNITKSYLFEPKEVILEGEIKRILKVNENNVKFLADCKIKSNFLPNHKAYISINLRSIPKNFELIQNNKFNLIAKIRTPKAKNFLTQFDELKYAQNNNIHWFADAKYIDFSLIESNNSSIKNNFYKLVNDKIKKLYDESYRAFITAFILGDKSTLDYKNKNVYALNGTAHIFAVSGLHIGIFVFMLLFIFNFIKNEKLKYLIISLILVIYCILIDYPDSTIRTIFIVILIFYLSSEQLKKNYLNTLFGFLIILIVFFPSTIDNIGMQYSISAFGSIILFNNKLLEKLNIQNIKNKFLKLLLNSIIFSFSVSILILPLNAYYFNSFNILSILINVITIPIMSLSIFYSLISILISFVSIDIAEYFANSAELLIFVSNKINYLMFDFGNFINIKYYSFEFSLLFSILSLVILYTHKINLLFFRILNLIILLVISFNLDIDKKLGHFNKINEKYDIVSNLQSSSIIYKKNEYIFIIYEQRKFYSYYKPEFELINYINQNEENIIFIYSGDLGYELIKSIKNSKFKSFRLKLKDIDEINILLKQNKLYNKI